jgi:hypothetical protein
MAGRFCGECGALRKEGSQFCGNCGSPLTAGKTGRGPPPGGTALQRPPLSAARGARVPPARVAAAAVVIVILAGAALFFILPKFGIHPLSLFQDQAGPSFGPPVLAHVDPSKVHSFGSVRDTGSGYTMTTDPVSVSKDVSLQKTMTYSRQQDGKYAGTLALRFTGTSAGSLQYEETIPKSFATDVKYLRFSVQPDRVIQADPVVAWSKEVKGASEITVTSSETKTKEDARIAAEDALINSSMKECEKLKDEGDKLICGAEIVRKFRTNPKIGNLSSLGRNNPVDMIRAAIVSKDPHEWCWKLKDEEMITGCEQLAFTMYARDCNEGPAGAKADCIRKNLWTIENYHGILGVCEYITDPALKSECLGTVDASYCNGLSDQYLRDQCLAHAGQHKADVSFCSGIKDTTLNKECIGKVSLARLNESICSVISDPKERDSCISGIAIEKKDANLCFRVSDPEEKAQCIKFVGIQGMISDELGGIGFWNLSLCNSKEMSASEDAHDFCISMVAARNINPDLCEQVRDEDSRNTCFLALSLAGDTSVCTRIADDMLKDHCFKIIAEGTSDPELCDDIEDKALAAECRNNTRHGVNAGTVMNASQLGEARQRLKSPNAGLNPAGTICDSPAFKLASKVVALDSDAGEGGGIDPDHCYQAIAVNLGDTSLCNNIRRPAPKSKCYMLIAEKQGTTDSCFLMPDPMESMDSYSQIECIQSVAIRTGNSQLCDEMGDRKISRMLIGMTNKSMCYQRVAGAKTAGRSP